MEFVFETILELFCAVYYELMTAFLPKTKLKKYQMKVIAGTEALVLIILLIIGVIILAETTGQSVTGKVLTGVSLSVIVLQMAFGLTVKIRKSKKK